MIAMGSHGLFRLFLFCQTTSDTSKWSTDISGTPLMYSRSLLSSSTCETIITEAVEAKVGCMCVDPYITEPIVYLEQIISNPASRLRAVPHFI